MMWEKVRLKEICTLFDDGDWIETKHQSETGIRLIQTGNVKTGYFSDRIDKARYISEETFASLKCTEIFCGDILVSRLPQPVGRACIIPPLDERAITAVDCTIIRVQKEKVIPEFLIYFMQSPSYFSSVQSGVTGSTRQRISRKKLGEIPILLPPLAEQQRIVAKLDAAFAEIDTAIEAAVTKETEVQKLKASLLSSSLSDDAVTWKTQKLRDVIEKGETINPTINPDAMFSYIDVSSVDRKSFRISETQILFGKDAPSRARRVVKTGDVLFATVRPTLQRIAIIPEILNGEVCSTGYIVLRPKASIICSKFIFFYMLSEKVNIEMERLQTGASYPAVNDTQIKNLNISFPPLAEQQRIVAKLEAAYSEFEKVNEAIIKSKANYLALKLSIINQELQSEVA